MSYQQGYQQGYGGPPQGGYYQQGPPQGGYYQQQQVSQFLFALIA